jgi:hypothetical protein
MIQSYDAIPLPEYVVELATKELFVSIDGNGAVGKKRIACETA